MIDDKYEDIQLVFDALAQTPLGKRRGTFDATVRCPICDEDGKTRKHSHCYVGLIDNQPPVVYHCWINDCSGVVTPNFLHDLNIFDLELDTILNTFNRSFRNINRISNKISTITKRKEKMVIPDIEDNPVNEYKLRYMQWRLGIKFSYADLKGLKIIFSLYDFLKANRLDRNQKYSKWDKVIDRDYIGFLTVDNDWLVLRNTQNNDNLRYIKYSLFNSIDTSNIIYTVPGTQSDLFSDYVNLNICEGPFDALGIFSHVKKFNRSNNIYAACCGPGYINAIRYFIKMGFIGNLKVDIYSDADKDLKFYKKMGLGDKIEPWTTGGIDIFYNELSKDYGVPRKDISIIKANRVI